MQSMQRPLQRQTKDCTGSGKSSTEASTGADVVVEEAGAVVEAAPAAEERGSGSAPEMNRSTCTDSQSPTSSDKATPPEALSGNFRTQKAPSRVQAAGRPEKGLQSGVATGWRKNPSVHEKQRPARPRTWETGRCGPEGPLRLKQQPLWKRGPLRHAALDGPQEDQAVLPQSFFSRSCRESISLSRPARSELEDPAMMDAKANKSKEAKPSQYAGV